MILRRPRYRARRRRLHGGYVHLAFVVTVVIGGAATVEYGDRETVRRQQEACEPVTRHERTDHKGWALLIDQGYVERADRLYPPGCEAPR